jgi:hypothetical protein
MRRKKGQIAGEPLLYILAALVFGGVLLFGISSIGGLRQRSAQVDIIEFKTHITDDISSLSKSFRDTKKQTYNLPSGYKELCVVDLKQVKPEDIIGHPLIRDSVDSKAQANVFLLGDKFENFYAKDLAVAEAPFYSCVNAKSGQVEVRMEGHGDSTLVKLQAPS